MKKITVKDRIIAISLIFLIVAIPSGLLILLTPNRSEIMVPGNTVMTVDGTKVSVGFFNYFYKAATSPEVLLQLESEYKDFDGEEPFVDQIYDSESGMTWHEYFVEAAKEQIVKIVSLSNKGEAMGLELLEEQEEEIRNQIKDTSKKAEEYGVLIDDYITIVYGEFVGKATLEKIMEKSFVAQNYYEYISIHNKPSNEETDEFLKNNFENMKAVSFDYFVVQYTDDYEDKIDKVNFILNSSNNSEELEDAVAEFFPTYDVWGFPATETVKMSSFYKKDSENLPAELIDWLYSPARKSGDKTFVNDDSKDLIYIVLLKEPAGLNDEDVCSMREILIEFDETQESRNEAMYKSENILKQVEESENPEYTFAVLADIYLKDFGEMKYSGGLVGDISYGESEEKINSWIFDESRKNGDLLSITGEKGCYVMFFSDRCEGWRFEAEQELISARAEEASHASDVVSEYAYKKYVINM